MKRSGALLAAASVLWLLALWNWDDLSARPHGRMRGGFFSSYNPADGGDAEAADGGDAAADGGDAAADGGDAAADGGDAAADGGDATADGGDAAADGGDAAADGGDAAADGGDAAADGGDATTSPLDVPSPVAGTLICAWDWVNYTSGSLNPLTAYAGSSGSACSVNEFASPNQTGANATTGFTYIGNRTNWLMNNGSSGGWGQTTSFALPSTSGNLLLRITGKSPATWASLTMFTLQGESNAAIFKINCDAIPRCIGTFDDGPGSASTAIVTSVSTSKNFFADLHLDDSTHKVTFCYNGTCTVAATASGSTSILTPDAIGVGGLTGNTQIWTGSLLDVQLFYGVSGWSQAQSAADCAVALGGAGNCTP